MRFRADWRAPALWIFCSLVTIPIAFDRLRTHRWHGGSAWFQFLCWTFIGLVWSLRLLQSWKFERDRIVVKRFPLPNLSIPYACIKSIDWTHNQNISLTLDELSLFRSLKKRIIMVRDTSGFLSEMEHHVTPEVLHI